MSETLAARAEAILHDWVQSESLRKHCYAVADSMKHFAQLRGEDADLWEAVGLLHDMDYERHPFAVAGVGDPGSTEQAASDEPGSPIPARAGHPFVVSRGYARTVGAMKCAARSFRTLIIQVFHAKRIWRKLSTQRTSSAASS